MHSFPPRNYNILSFLKRISGFAVAIFKKMCYFCTANLRDTQLAR